MSGEPAHPDAATAVSASPAPRRLRDSVRRIVPLAWPVFIGQLAVLGFGTIDTVLVARHSPTDLAALAVELVAELAGPRTAREQRRHQPQNPPKDQPRGRPRPPDAGRGRAPPTPSRP